MPLYTKYRKSRKSYTNQVERLKKLKNTFIAKPTSINNQIKVGLTTKYAKQKGIAKKVDSGSNPGTFVMPTTIKNFRKNGPVLANIDGPRQVFTTVYETGFKPSKTVLQSAAENGVAVKTVSDSKIELRTSELRNALTQGFGFNEKQYHVPNTKSLLPRTSVRNILFGDTLLEDNLNFDRDVLHYVMNLKQQFMIKNQSTNLAIDFTVHLVEINETSLIEETFPQTFANCFYDLDQFTTDPAEPLQGKIPLWYQSQYLGYENNFLESDPLDLSCSVACSSKLKSLRKASANFREAFTIVESFSHLLKPGEYWNFSHIHNCGAGIDGEGIMNYNRPYDEDGNPITGQAYDPSRLPFTYGIIFETKGRMCEAQVVVESTVADGGYEVDTYLGTSPGQYMYEFKTSVNFVKDALNSNIPFYKVNETRDYVFENELASLSLQLKEIRLPIGNWKTDLESIDASSLGQYIVPFTSQSTQSTAVLTGSQSSQANI